MTEFERPSVRRKISSAAVNPAPGSNQTMQFQEKTHVIQSQFCCAVRSDRRNCFFGQVPAQAAIGRTDVNIGTTRLVVPHSRTSKSVNRAEAPDGFKLAKKRTAKRLKRKLRPATAQAVRGFKNDAGTGATADEDPHLTCNQSGGEGDCKKDSLAGTETTCRIIDGGMSSEPGGGVTCSVAPLN